MKISLECHFDIEIDSPDLKNILATFAKFLPLVLSDFIQKILLAFAEMYMQKIKVKPWACKCGNNEDFIWNPSLPVDATILT